jgi:type IV pilus assembly protein PilN
LQNNQNARNKYLTKEISKLDKKIKEINRLRAQKDNLIARMEVIQNLQRERTQVVHLLDDMVRKLPDGVFFETVAKKGSKFSFTGTAQSNARVSSLMEKLDSSDWFANPNLNVINIAPSQGVRLSQFDLKVSQQKSKPKQVASDG